LAVVSVASPEAVAAALETQGYLADEGVATAAYLAVALRRPLFVEGDAGVGKTALAHALAGLLDAPLIRLQCYEGIDAAEALYDWDFPRQVLHLRTVEAATGDRDVAALERELYGRDFLRAGPLLQALETEPTVLLIDEIDRADDEFEAFLLEVLSDFTVSIPQLGTIRAATPPVVVITSNRTRDVHDALKRRCLYHWIEHPSFDHEIAIVCRRCPAATRELAQRVTAAVQRLRAIDLVKPPGIAETIDWTDALVALGLGSLDAEAASRTLGAVLKYREDQQRVMAHGVAEWLLLDEAAGNG
jgi:MoxR-like ATPase